MTTINIPDEKDIKQWIKEAVREYFEETAIKPWDCGEAAEEPLLTRKEIAGFLKISLVTLHDWMKKGLPYHKNEGKVYFVKKDVMGYIKSGK